MKKFLKSISLIVPAFNEEEILEETKELSNILATIVISAKNKKF